MSQQTTPQQVIATVTTPAPLRMFRHIIDAVAREYPQARMRQTGDIIEFVIPAQESLLTPDP